MSKKKGILREIISKALYHEDVSLYSVSYRDFERIVDMSLKDFLCASNNLETIPITRITEVRRKDQILYKKASNPQIQS